MRLIDIRHADDGVHKYTASFQTEHGVRDVKFGAFGYQDYTQHGDDLRKKMYLARHKTREHWDNPITPGSLSRYLLWNKPTLRESLKYFKRRFNV
jgi:hypothetical protein